MAERDLFMDFLKSACTGTLVILSLFFIIYLTGRLLVSDANDGEIINHNNYAEHDNADK